MIHSSEAVYMSGNKLLHFNLISPVFPTVGREIKVAVWCLEKRLLDCISGRGVTLATPHNRYVYLRGLCLYHSTDVYV